MRNGGIRRRMGPPNSDVVSDGFSNSNYQGLHLVYIRCCWVHICAAIRSKIPITTLDAVWGEPNEDQAEVTCDALLSERTSPPLSFTYGNIA